MKNLITKKFIVRFYSLLFFSMIILFSCGEADKSGQGSSGEPKPALRPKFYSPDNEGIWKGKSETHLPQIQFLDNANDKIRVTIPLTGNTNPRHYIEVIVLMQGERNQIGIKQFQPTETSFTADFTLPEPSATDYYIVGKCNLHDMWRTPVAPQKK
jgi:desulfoferrodoxin (superoxide reductase-like protein)